MHLERVTAPTEACVSVALVKQNRRIRHALEDELIAFFIRSAEDYVERVWQIAIMRGTFRLTGKPAHPKIPIPMPPLHHLTSVTFEDDGVVTYPIVPLVQERQTAYIDGERLPTSKALRSLDVTIEFEAGYDSAANVPPAIRQAVLMIASHFDENREATTNDPRISRISRAVEFGVENLLAPFRVWNTHYEWHGVV